MITETPGVMATLTLEQCRRPDFLIRMANAGMDGVRINSAHVNVQELRFMVAQLRQYCRGTKILMDTKGPELRTTSNINGKDIIIEPGTELAVANLAEPCGSKRICVAAEGFGKCIRPGVQLLIDDGALVLEITGTGTAMVKKGGVLGERKTVNVKGAEMPPLPPVSDSDRAHLLSAVELGVEMVAHSFVRSEEDINAVRKLLGNAPVALYAKIETAQGANDMERILAAADGLLVARGDLSQQVPYLSVPSVQMSAAMLCRREKKPLIVATGVLDTMKRNPMPARAEMSDLVLGVLQGARYMLLCGETAQGGYPVECVETAAAVMSSVCGKDLWKTC